MMKYLLPLLVFYSMTLTGCYKSKIADDTPKCMEKVIKQLNKREGCAIAGESGVLEYLFQNETVYVVYGDDCFMEGKQTIYDQECNIIGQILTQYGGDPLVRGEGFSNAIFVREVWEK